MSIFVKLERLDPYDTFATVMRRSRLAMQSTYVAAFEAHKRCRDLLRDHRWQSINVSDPLGFPIFGVPDGWNPEPTSREELDRMWLDAISEDFHCDHLAAPIVLSADDSLKRLVRGIQGRPTQLEDGWGPKYGPGEVPLSSLLTAATNTLRHVSEWDEKRKPTFPYKLLDEYEKGSEEWMVMRNITIIQRAFGIGKHEPVRDPVNMRVLIAVDGQLGTAEPSYARFEEAVLETARAIAAAKGKTSAQELEIALRRQDYNVPLGLKRDDKHTHRDSGAFALPARNGRENNETLRGPRRQSR